MPSSRLFLVTLGALVLGGSPREGVPPASAGVGIVPSPLAG